MPATSAAGSVRMGTASAVITTPVSSTSPNSAKRPTAG